jgi:thiol:disulfide interchange protein
MEDRSSNPELSRKARMTILAVVLLLIAAVLVIKYALPGVFTSNGGSAQAKIDQAVEQGKPVMVFFYSEDCLGCREMEKNITAVYPEFKKYVVLVEVNVYEDKNRELMERTGVHTTPVELFIDGKGTETLVLDAMNADDLREQLASFSGGQP